MLEPYLFLFPLAPCLFVLVRQVVRARFCWGVAKREQILLLAKQRSSLHATRKGVGRTERQRENDMSDGDAGTTEAGEAVPPTAPSEGAGTDQPSAEAFRVQAMQVYRR